MSEVAYCTREQVQHALSQADSVKNNTRIDAAISAASRDLEGYCRRYFYPTTATRYPNVRRHAQGDTLWLNQQYEISTVTSLVLDGVTATAGTDYFLDPEPAYPLSGYTSIRLANTGSAAWPADDRSIVLTGTFGASTRMRNGGITLAAALADATSTTLTVSDSGQVGVGDLITIDSERLLMTDKNMTSSTATVAATVDAASNTTSVQVSNGTLVRDGELIQIGTERMFVEEVIGNVLIVKRAQNASTLAAHAIADVVYVPRLATVERGAYGSTAAAHSNGAPIYVNFPPSLVSEAAIALALNNLEQARSAYAREIGAGDTAREASGRGVATIVADCVQQYGRGPRIGVA